MSIEELVGSMLVFGFNGSSFDEPKTRAQISELKAIHARGVILFDHDIAGNHPRNIRSPKQLTKLIEDLRNELGSELIVSIDQEGGSVARLGESNGFLPTMSAIEFARLAEIDQIQYANKQARQLAKLGIDLNFAPCVDLAVEPDSPIIAGKGRAFGNTLEEAARCAQIVIDAHRDAGVRCCIKHFPGHGSALLDSHLGICDITATHTTEELDIFRELILVNSDAIAVMGGHLVDRRIDKNLPASISELHTQGVLREQLGFGGVVVTDSMDMRAILDGFGEVDAYIHAINAGNDLLLDGLNAPGYRQSGVSTRIAEALVGAVKDGRVESGMDRLEASRERVDRFMGRSTRTRAPR
jgi:beta-N-acetylhexosaminidase